MARSVILFILLFAAGRIHAQTQPDTMATEQQAAAAEDPSQFITRVELFNEVQHFDGFDLNRTVLRSAWKVGKRFSTRLDIPFVYNSISTPVGHEQTGLGDISFRLLGYQLREAPRSALTASMEVSLNTAASPLLGSGKNVLIPMVAYSRMSADRRTILAVAYQLAFSVGGDEDRRDLFFSKLQPFLIHFWSRRAWSAIAPEWYIDHMGGGTLMNVVGRQAFALTPRINVWAEAGAGLFGDFIPLYEWTAEIGCRYFLLRKAGGKGP